MRPTLTGTLTGPAVAIAGVWDPFLPEHRQVFADLCLHARRQRLSALAVVLDPNPGALMYGGPGLVYNEVGARIEMLCAEGFDAVLRLDFTQEDLRSTPDDFFAMLVSCAPIAEFWMGALQSLGVGTNITSNLVENLAAAHGIHLRRLPEVAVHSHRKHIWSLLATGRLVEAIALVGGPPVCSRPTSGPLRLSLPPGRYWAALLDSPVAGATGPAHEVFLIADGQRQAACEWPDESAGYLAFLSGPADEAIPYQACS